VNCSTCGAPVPAEAGFCRGCGTILRGSAALVATRSANPAARAPSAPARGAGPPGRLGAGTDDRMRRHMLVLDWGIIVGSGIVLASILLNWYQAKLVVKGVRVTVVRHLLSGDAGIQRPLVPIVAVLIVIEVLVNLARQRSTHEAWRAHRGVVMVLCVLQFVLVASCMLSSPLSANSLSNIGISVDTGPGGWVALAGAVVGVLAGCARMFAGRPALGRSAPTPLRAGGTARP
jgi:hypothetical protein